MSNALAAFAFARIAESKDDYADVHRAMVSRYLGACKAHNGSPLSNGTVIAYEAVVRDLVSVWEDHPDYDPDWSW